MPARKLYSAPAKKAAKQAARKAKKFSVHSVSLDSKRVKKALKLKLNVSAAARNGIELAIQEKEGS